MSYFLDGAAADKVEGRAASGTEFVEVETGQVLSVLSPVVPACLVAVVPDGVDFCGHTAQEGEVFVLDTDAECLGCCSAHACIIWVVVVGFKEARAVSAGALTFLSSLP